MAFLAKYVRNKKYQTKTRPEYLQRTQMDQNLLLSLLFASSYFRILASIVPIQLRSNQRLNIA